MYNNVKKIFFSGIGGIGLSALAQLYLAQGKIVAGSDMVETDLTKELEKKKITVYCPQHEKNITSDIDLLIYSAAVPAGNPERVKAKELGIKQQSYPEALGNLTKLYKTIAVSGTNGKSTTTAMLAGILIDAKIDPTVILGSLLPQIKGNFRSGKSDCLVLEACEYRGHFLNITPGSIILTNIEEEHLDYFTDLEHIRSVFQQYIDKLTQPDNILVINNDDMNITQLELPECKVISYGINENSDLMAGRILVQNGAQNFAVNYKGNELGEFSLKVPGKFNVYNALGAMAMALNMGVSVESIRNSLKKYSGIWRRFEKIKDNDLTVISDYAHHPTAVKSTITAAREFYPGQRLAVVFQPHQYDRTQKLFNQFVESLYDADLIILPEIFEVIGRGKKIEAKVSSKDLVQAIKKRWPDKKTLYAKDNEQALDLINFNAKPKDVILVMGAGDIYTIARRIVLKSKS